MLPLRHSLIAAVAALCAFAGPAAAAYAPKLDVKIDPGSPGQPVAITSTITQAGGETPNKTVKVSFPAGFTTNTSTSGICTKAQEDARACPDNTKIGDAKATASILGLPVELSGPVHYGGPQPDNTIKLIVFLNNDTLNQHQTIEGFVSLRPSDAGFDTTFDNLPNTLTTSFTLAFSGGTLALTRTPVKCGTFPFKAHFTSQNGEQSDASSNVTVSGCTPTPPRIGALSFSPEKVRAGKSTTLDFTLSEPAALLIDVKSQRKGHKRLFKLNRAGKRGTDDLRLKIPKGARPGRYKVTIVATGDDGLTGTRAETLTVLKRKK